MSPAEARTLAQADPVPVLTARWGDQAAQVRTLVARLERELLELAKTTEQLAERNLTVHADLGPVGDAARAALQTTQEHASRHPQTFSLKAS